MKKSLILIVHNIRSAHNVGSLLRTCDGLGVEKLFCTGYTPYPQAPADNRLPHLSARIAAQIKKTALGAETTQAWEQQDDIQLVIKTLRATGYRIVALEQAKGAITLPSYKAPPKLALIVGREVEGIEQDVLDMVDEIVEIPMRGHKESLNVAQAAAIALYHCQNMT
jgi:tRNA G18 (ribose-2'-O)-methylase SpoU